MRTPQLSGQSSLIPRCPEYGGSTVHVCIHTYLPSYCVYVCVCSEISDSGHSKIRTVSPQRTQLEAPHFILPIIPIHFKFLTEDSLLTNDNFLVVPECPLFRANTVCKYILTYLPEYCVWTCATCHAYVCMCKYHERMCCV